jgi:hypothetical protein
MRNRAMYYWTTICSGLRFHDGHGSARDRACASLILGHHAGTSPWRRGAWTNVHVVFHTFVEFNHGCTDRLAAVPSRISRQAWASLAVSFRNSLSFGDCVPQWEDKNRCACDHKNRSDYAGSSAICANESSPINVQGPSMPSIKPGLNPFALSRCCNDSIVFVFI